MSVSLTSYPSLRSVLTRLRARRRLVLGTYEDASGVWHGLLRAPDGTFTTFDPPWMAPIVGGGTWPGVFNAIIPDGASTGSYQDANSTFHGYLRTWDGKFITFDDPYAGTGAWQGTQGYSINRDGTISCSYGDGNNAWHGCLRGPDGTIRSFDVSGAGTGAWQGLTGYMIMNPAGAITSFYVDADDVSHGFVRAPDGIITKFDVPGAGTGAGQGTFPLTINPAGAITGYYADSSWVMHGFLRTP